MPKTKLDELNGYQAEAVNELLHAFNALPQSRRLTYECRGIVGGDFDVVITRRLDVRQSAEQRTKIEVFRA